MDYSAFLQRLLWGGVATTYAATAVLVGGCGSAAGNAGVAGLGVGAGVTLFTHSCITVHVDTFQDTLLGTSDRRKFQLPKGTALVQQAIAEADPLQNPTLDNMVRAQNALAVQIGGLDAQLARLKGRGAPTIPTDPPAGFQDAAKNVQDARTNLEEAIQAAESDFDDFSTAVTVATHPNVTEDETLAMLRGYGKLTSSLERIHRSNGELKGAWDNCKSVAEKMKLVVAEDLRNKMITVQSTPAARNLAPQAMQQLIQQNPEVQKARARLDELQNSANEADTSVKDNTSIDTLSNVNLVYDGLLADTNFGPLISEAMQDVMSRGGAIDVMLEPKYCKYWRQFQSASSYTGPGDQNAVIYLENMGTPILKTGSFDPSQFIAAFGNLYRVALSSLATAVSTPVAVSPTTKPATGSKTKTGGAGAQGSANAASGSNTTSVLTAETDKANADASSAQSRVAMLAAFNAVLTAQAPFNKTGPPTAADAQAASSALISAAAALGNAGSSSSSK